MYSLRNEERWDEISFYDINRTMKESASRVRRRVMLESILEILSTAPRIGTEKDDPEGNRYIQISDTLAYKMIETIKQYIKTG